MVIWSEPAKADLRSIHDFIALDSKYYAKKVTQDIREKTDILNKLPNMGKKVPETGEENIKELSLYSYRIIYEIKTNDLTPFFLPPFFRANIIGGYFTTNSHIEAKVFV